MNWRCGHPRTEANTQSVGAAGVRCRECRRAIGRRWARNRRRKDLAAAAAAPAPPLIQPDMFGGS